MKKNVMLMTIISLLSIAGCSNGNDTSSSSILEESSSVAGIQYGDSTDLIISEYVEGTGSDKAIEVYNMTDKEVDLSEYAINQYRNEFVPTVTVQLKGKLAPKSTYVVAYEGSSDEVLAKADQTDIGLYFSGKNAISLTKNNKVVDVIGFIGYALDYAKDMTLVRKVDMMEPRRNFDEYDWIRYAPDNFKYLGDATNSATPEELLNGPVLESQYLDNQKYLFKQESGNLAGGLAVQASIKNNIDGDTTDLIIHDSQFDPTSFMTSTSYYGKTNGKYWVRVRYQAVDTPESYSGNIQEFGIIAKHYTAYLQNKANVLYLQSVYGDSLLCNYGRVMGYVWAGSDTLVNYESIKRGYSTVTFNFHYELTSRDIPYESYMYNAMLYAKRNKLGLYGEKDPYWNYDTGKSMCEYKECENLFEKEATIVG